MTPVQNDPNHTDVHSKVLNAIRDALKEEKEPIYKRILKILGATFVALFLLGLPFLIFFRTQMTGIWYVIFAFWAIYFLVGFTLLFKPQPRLLISGIWSPFVIARLFLVSTVTTILQIIICPSFVFLSSPLEWNPLSTVTNQLIRLGGMDLCMGFCGFLFSVIAAAVGIRSVDKVAKAPSLRSSGIMLLILLVSEFPVILVQVMSEELRPFALSWVEGMLLGFGIILVTKIKMNRINKENRI